MKDEKRIVKIEKRTRYLVRAGVSSLKREGIAATAKKMLRVLGIHGYVSPAKWAKTPLYSIEELEEQRRLTFDKDIVISIITPLYNTSEKHLRDMIDSVIAQTYPKWELCMTDGSGDGFDYIRRICSKYADGDSRIKYKKLEKDLGIAGNSNACMNMSTGEYIALLDHDDVLHPAALFDVMKAVCDENADFVYTDEAIFEDPDIKNIISVHCKPDFSIDNLRANNYICHLVAFKRSLAEKCGRFRDGFDGAMDFDLVLRLTSAAEKIVHVPEVLYFWRIYDKPAAFSEEDRLYPSEAGRKAVMCSLEDAGLEAKIETTRDAGTHYRIRYELPRVKPKVSIIIPNRDHADDLRCCIDSVLQKTTYTNYEIIVVENKSTDPDTFTYYDKIKSSNRDRIHIVKWPGNGFNWAAINNFAIQTAADRDYVLLLNNDTEVINSDWIEEMLMYAQRPDVGIVGAMLYYPDETIQHAGVIIGLGGTAGHAFAGHRRGETGYMGRLCYAQDVSAVTGACMLMRREVFDEVGGIDEKYAVNLNDIDLCLRVKEAGYLIVWTPYAELYHFESKSRRIAFGTTEDTSRTMCEIKMFQDRWHDIIVSDPYYNPNLSLKRSFEFEKMASREVVPTIIKKTVRKTARRTREQRYRMDMLLFPQKTMKRCPCCGMRFRSFMEGSFLEHPELVDVKRYEKTRQDVICPVCESLPRHRILALWCNENKALLHASDILYFAPEKSMMTWMNRNNILCLTADKYEDADMKLDIQNTNLPEGSFDIVFCNHVLEHVEDYCAALREVHRILRPGGSLICSFPVDQGIDILDEDTEIKSEAERILRFGQRDHLRVFGIHADKLLEKEGFEVKTINGSDCPEEIMPEIGPADYDVDQLFICKKAQ